jgi:hypothetical protein
MNVLPFLEIRISHGLDNLTELSLAAGHYITNNFVGAVVLGYLGDAISLRLGVPHRLSLFRHEITPSQG